MTMRSALTAFAFGALALVGCDRTPAAVKALEAKRLPAVRELMRRVQKECTGKGPEYKVTDWGAFASDEQVLNARATCKPVTGLGMATQLEPMRPVPPGDKSGSAPRIGISRDKKPKDDPFPRETARIPSWLTAEPGAVDFCVTSGHPDDVDFTEVCVAFKAPPST